MQEINSLSILTHRVIQSNAAVVVGILAEKEATVYLTSPINKICHSPINFKHSFPCLSKENLH